MGLKLRREQLPKQIAHGQFHRTGEGEKEAQYAHFLEAAREAEASTDPRDFDKAFKNNWRENGPIGAQAFYLSSLGTVKSDCMTRSCRSAMSRCAAS